MKTLTPKRVLVFFCFGFVAAISSSTGVFAGSTTLFTVERNTNANQVVYELRADDSIHPYWHMLAQDGHTEELNMLERTQAFGVQIISKDAASMRFSVKALPAYPFTVEINPPAGQAYATIRLMGADRTVKRIYLHVSGGLFPKVSSLDFEVQNGDTGPLLYFNLVPTGSTFKESQISCTHEWTPGC